MCSWVRSWSRISPLLALLLGSQVSDAITLADIERVISAGPYSANWSDIVAQYTVPKWFVDGKFGFYTHWGAYSVPAYKSEWYPRNMYRAGDPENANFVSRFGALSINNGYKNLIPQFKGEFFNATEWMRVFHAAGARYAGPVGEHHDGFAMCTVALLKLTPA